MEQLKLRDYQLEDIEKLKHLDAVGLFNEPRTGKTPTALKLMQAWGCHHCLIICPASMIPVWAQHIRDWLNQPAYFYGGTPKNREAALANLKETGGYLILSYDLFRGTKEGGNLSDLILKLKPKMQGVIFDEAHRITGKRNTLTFKSCRRLVKIDKRIYVSGTPAVNKPESIWNILTMINPYRFSSYWNFIGEFFAVEEVKLSYAAAAKTGISYKQEVSGFREGCEAALAKELATFSTNRKQIDVMPWLPKRPEPIRVRLKPTRYQLGHLANLEEYFETDSVVVRGTLDRLIRYRQITSCPATLGLYGRSPKVDWVIDYLKDYPDEKVIIFAKFKQTLNVLAREIDKLLYVPYTIITGDVPVFERKIAVDSFNKHDAKVILIQTDAGKEGLTLDSADTTIVFEVYPPVTDLQQLVQRMTPTTKEKVKQQKLYYLVLEHTYDEVIYDMVERGLEDTDIVNSYAKYHNQKGLEG